ncbi:lipopolysaccharide kinase InaA family protein [Candidatus Neomarinimicrobiota bacterium]
MDRNDVLKLAVQVWKNKTNLVAELDAEDGRYVIKWFGWRFWIHKWLSPSFAGRALTSWDIALRLKSLGVPTPEPVYLYCCRRRGIIRENFMVTRAISEHQTMRRLLKNDTPEETKNTVVRNLAKMLSRMHDAGISHGDLTTANMLIGRDYQVYLVDLNRAKIYKKLSRSTRLNDLKRLQFGTGDSKLSDALISLFFEVYSDTIQGSSWEQAYRKARGRLLAYRSIKKSIRC